MPGAATLWRDFPFTHSDLLVCLARYTRMMKNTLTRQNILLVMTCISLACSSGLVRAQPSGAATDEFFQRMGELSTQAEQFVPGFLREVSPEQMRRLESVVLDIREEREFGQAVLKRYEQQLHQAGTKILRQGQDVDYLAKLVGELRPYMSHAERYPNIRIGVVETDETDAFSIPGGELLITARLLETAESEAAVVAVLAHELSHLDRGHQLYTPKQAKLANRSRNFADMMGAVAAFAKPFHPEFESQADQDAVAWTLAAGYDPRELAKLLSHWNDRQDQRQPWMKAVPAFVKSHPDAGKRAQAVLTHLRRLNPRQPDLYIGRQNLQKRLTRSQRQFPE